MRLIDWIVKFIAGVCVLASWPLVGWIAYQVGDQNGVRKGRAQYHHEILSELESKNGAPVLLYPPKGMFND